MTTENIKNLEIINNHIGYGYPELAEIFIFAIEEAGNSNTTDDCWKNKFYKIYKTKYEKIKVPFWLTGVDFNTYDKNCIKKEEKAILINKLYGRYKNLYNNLFDTKITNLDIGCFNANKLFIGNLYPISKPSTNISKYSEIDVELFGVSDFYDWEKNFWNYRRKILQNFLLQISETNREIKLITFSAKRDKERCKKLVCDIFGIKNDIIPKTFVSIRRNSDNKYFEYHYNNISIYNCDSLSNSWVTNDQLRELGLF